MDMPYRVPHSDYPQTGLEEINGNFLQADSSSGVTFGLLVILPPSRSIEVRVAPAHLLGGTASISNARDFLKLFTPSSKPL